MEEFVSSCTVTEY